MSSPPVYNMVSILCPDEPGTEFTEETAPTWLRYGGHVGSTADNRWFWNNHISKLKVNAAIDTEFNRITRIS